MSPDEEARRAGRAFSARLRPQSRSGLPPGRWIEGFLAFSLLASVWVLAGEPAWIRWVLGAAGIAMGALAWREHRRSTLADTGGDAGAPSWIGRSLLVLTLVILLWCLVSAANSTGRPTFVEGVRVAAQPRVTWLPHSADAPRSWLACWQALGLAGLFWAVRIWIMEGAGESSRRRKRRTVPQTLQRLLWFLGLNGALLAAVGMLQRATGTSRLLGLFPTPIPPPHLGPFAYSDHAAQYLNLLWPVLLAFWVFGQPKRERGYRIGSSPSILLPVVSLLMLAGVVTTTSATGTLLAVVAGGVLLVLLGRKPPENHLPAFAVGSAAFLAALAALVWSLSPLVPLRVQAGPAAVPTTQSAGLRQFTLVGVFDLPETLEQNQAGLLGLSDSPSQLYGEPNALVLQLSDAGALILRTWGNDPTRYHLRRRPDFFPAHAGTRLVLAVVRPEAGPPEVYVNGRVLELETPAQLPLADWPDRFAARHAWIGRLNPNWGQFPGRIHRLLLWNQALEWNQIQTLLDGNDNRDPSLPRPLVDSAPPAPGLLTARNPLAHLASAWGLDRPPVDRPILLRWFGSGPGTWVTPPPARRPGPQTVAGSPGDARVIWLTFGTLGTLPLALAAILILARPFFLGGLRAPVGLIVLLYTVVLTCLLHTAFGSPLQAPAVRTLLVALGAILSTLTFHRPARTEPADDDRQPAAPVTADT